MSAATSETTISPAAFARRYAVGLGKVLHWLAMGELGGIDVSLGRKLKPRWRIREVDIERFEARRANTTAPTQHRRARSEPTPEGSVAFFAES